MELGDAENLVLVTFDSLRADVLTGYGGERKVMPNLEEVSENGLVFQDFYANGPKTPAAMPSVFSGRLPFEGDYGEIDRSFVEELSDLGYRTYGFQRNALLNPENGFSRGFDRFDYRGYFVSRISSALDRLGLSRAAEKIFRRYERWKFRKEPREMLDFLEEVEMEDPFFLWFHVTSCHFPYLPSEKYSEQFGVEDPGEINSRIREDEKSEELAEDARAAYEARLREIDERFISRLREEVPDDTALMITADHGEEFLDHGGWLHSMPEPKLYNELLKVPMLLEVAGAGAGEIEERHQQIEIPGLVLQALGEEVPEEYRFERDEVVSQVRGNLPGKAVPDDSAAVSVVSGDHKYISTPGGEELYDLGEDPGEQRDVSGEEPGTVEELRAKVPGESPGAQGEEEEIRRRLEFLGYGDR
ncbi:MAG: sulfatase [Candidatus Nanohaloarchaea archaeon]